VVATLTANYSSLATIFIVGPTASGKSDLAMDLARALGGEIIAADSQTIRRGLDIGTAKPSKKDQQEIRHHLIDIVGLRDAFSVADFKERALKALKDIKSRGKLPIIVGGTGLYIDSLFFNYDLQKTSDQERSDLNKKSIPELQKIIKKLEYKLPINQQNPRHLIGVIMRKGKKPKNNTPIHGALIYGVISTDQQLKGRIKRRIDIMYKKGLVKEVTKLLEKDKKSVSKVDAICYSIVERYIDGKITLEQAKEEHMTAEWHYARKQKSWFRRNPYIKWINNKPEEIEQIIKELNSI